MSQHSQGKSWNWVGAMSKIGVVCRVGYWTILTRSLLTSLCVNWGATHSSVDWFSHILPEYMTSVSMLLTELVSLTSICDDHLCLLYLTKFHFICIRYDSVYLTYSKKLTGSQLSLPHGTNKKLKSKTKNKMMSVIGPVQSRYREAVQ